MSTTTDIRDTLAKRYAYEATEIICDLAGLKLEGLRLLDPTTGRVFYTDKLLSLVTDAKVLLDCIERDQARGEG